MTAAPSGSARPPSLAATQAAALIAVIETRRDQRCARLIAEAEAEAARIVAAARAHARRRFHDAAETLRRDGARRLAHAEAARDAELRRRRREALSALVEQAWPRLADALAARWRDGAARARWIAAALDVAAARLAPEGWRVDCAPGAVEEIRRALAARENVQGSVEPDAAIAAGLRVRLDGAVVDAEAGALLAQRPRVEAALMAEIDRLSGADRGAARPETEAEAPHG